MKKLLFLAQLICVLSYTASAQVPGFMGKRIAIGYNLDVGFPVFRGTDWRKYSVQSNYKGEDIGFNLYPRQNITLEYVVGKQISIEGSMGFSKSGLVTYENEDGYLKDEYPGLSSYYDEEPYNTPKSYDYLRVNNRMFRIGINLFSGSYIAPHGNYWNFSYILNKGTVQYVLDDKASDLSVITNHGFMITKGYRRIIASSFILDIGFGFGYAFGEKTAGEQNSMDSGSEEPITTVTMQTSALNSSILFNGHIGIKYMIPKF